MLAIAQKSRKDMIYFRIITSIKPTVFRTWQTCICSKDMAQGYSDIQDKFYLFFRYSSGTTCEILWSSGETITKKVILRFNELNCAYKIQTLLFNISYCGTLLEFHQFSLYKCNLKTSVQPKFQINPLCDLWRINNRVMQPEWLSLVWRTGLFKQIISPLAYY